LAYGVEHLTEAVAALASGEGTLATRLETCWTAHVQMVWMKPCLTPPMLDEFRSLWERYTAPSDDPHSTVLREMSTVELATAARHVVDLAFAAASVAATSPPDAQPA
jgi:hypothetical protein